MKDKSYESALLSLPLPEKDPYGSISMPVYRTMAYEFATAEEMEACFSGKTNGYNYSRITNPGVAHFEERIRHITGAHGVTAFNSGMAAISNAFLTLAWSGANIVTTHKLFGNTYSFFVNTLRDFGVEVRFCDLSNLDEVEKRIDKNTCAIFAEIIANPQMEVLDLGLLGAIAAKNDIPFLVDSTLIPFTNFHAKDFGITIEMISSTKYVSGGGSSLGGLIIDYGNFDWSKSPKLQPLASETASAFHFRLRKEIHRNLGAYMTADAAYLQSLGLETMQIRYERQNSTAMQLAEKLKSHAAVISVQYPGLNNNPYHEIAKKQFNGTFGGMFTFDLESKEACFAFLNRLKIIRRATNLFENRTLILHPASTIYGSFTEEQRAPLNVRNTTIRISVGLEDVETLFEDLNQALDDLDL